MCGMLSRPNMFSREPVFRHTQNGHFDPLLTSLPSVLACTCCFVILLYAHSSDTQQYFAFFLPGYLLIAVCLPHCLLSLRCLFLLCFLSPALSPSAWSCMHVLAVKKMAVAGMRNSRRSRRSMPRTRTSGSRSVAQPSTCKLNLTMCLLQ